jgi:hypothetical protein
VPDQIQPLCAETVQSRVSRKEYSGFAIVVVGIILPMFLCSPRALYVSLARSFEALSLLSPQSIFPLSNCLYFLTNTFFLILVVRYWEHGKVNGRGLSSPLLSSMLVGTAAWLLFEMSTPLLLWWGRLVVALASMNGGSHAMTLPPLDREIWNLSEGWLYVTVAADVIFEELVTRAYLIERLKDFIGSIWVAGAMSLVLSIALHIPGATFMRPYCERRSYCCWLRHIASAEV